jgi:hypothetical protein
LPSILTLAGIDRRSACRTELVVPADFQAGRIKAIQWPEKPCRTSGGGAPPPFGGGCIETRTKQIAEFTNA